MWREVKSCTSKTPEHTAAKCTATLYALARVTPSRWLPFGLMLAFLAFAGCTKEASSAGQLCGAGLVNCGQGCTDVYANVSNCGSCGNACPDPLVCSKGACLAACETGLTNVNRNCLSTGTANTPVSGGAGINTSTGPTGSAGNTGSATAGSPVGTSGAAGAISNTGAVGNGGYIKKGDWYGYLWKHVKGATMTPADMTGFADFPICVSGSIEASTDYSNLAIVGWNVKQNPGTAAGESYTPTGTGVTIGVTNEGASEIRLQIQGPTGETNENDRWCAVIAGTGSTITYSTFNTQCWEGAVSPTAYAKQPFNQVMVLVPSKKDAAVPYKFCINNIAEAK